MFSINNTSTQAAGASAAKEVVDLVVYGCTPAGLTAAIAAKSHQRSVVLLCRDKHVGGMTTNGLGFADTGNHAAIGGMARRFYRDVKAHYDKEGFKGVARSQSQSTGEEDSMWVFEPHVAEAIYMRWLKEAGIEPIFESKLRLEPSAVAKQGDRIVSIEMLGDARYAGRLFVDATYEGDLMAMAGVSFTTGREGNAMYGEDYNGVQSKSADQHGFDLDIDPYVKPGDPTSGLVPLIEACPPGEEGAGNKRIQARYQSGLLWFMQNDPRSPKDVRESMAEWGLCADEFVDNDHWPREMYVREARRMVSDFVMSERHLEGEDLTPRSIGLGSYTMGSHNVQRYVNADGFARNEGDIQIPLDRTYEISYGAIVPKADEATNLFVPVAVSASHIAYGSIRNLDVQNVSYDELSKRLREKGQLIEPIDGKYVPNGG